MSEDQAAHAGCFEVGDVHTVNLQLRGVTGKEEEEEEGTRSREVEERGVRITRISLT